jgi:replicative DNA helicase
VSSYLIGAKALKRLVAEKDAFAFVNARLTPDLFRGDEETAMFKFVTNHHEQNHVLPHMDTLEAQFPDLKNLDVPEPSKYYVSLVERRFGYETINKANLASQDILKADKEAVDAAAGVMRVALDRLTQQRYRHKILELGKDGPKLLLAAYYNMLNNGANAIFGWPYMDQQMGGLLGGDVVSIVGRPATGKTYHSLFMGNANCFGPPKLDTLFVSMEMNVLAIAQRQAAMYAHTNVTQLKTGSYSSLTFKKFAGSMQSLQKEEAKMYIVDGNLAASVEDIYSLAAVLRCKIVLIDGAYMMRHRNPRLDRFARVHENVEMTKKYTGELEIPTVASWQFNRKASEKQGKKGEEAGLEDIGSSDAIGQVSSIVIGLLQPEGVETMVKRSVKVLKGRNGEIGEFFIKWDFNSMDFTQWGLAPEEVDPGAPGGKMSFI